jgi:hypothetical protein
MPDEDTLVESVKFLLKSVRQLSDRFLEADAKLTRSFDGVAADVNDLLDRVEGIEKELLEFRDGAMRQTSSSPATPELPVRPETADRVVPAINLSTEAVIEAYVNTPILLEPFSRPCAVNGRTLSGEIDQVELELFAQGTTWALEALEGGWLLVPRPGSLERRAQIQTLERLFEIEGITTLPATLHLLAPATAVAVEHGRRWQLRHKGRLSIQPDPLQQGTGQRLQAIEQRLAKLEEGVRP